MLLSLGSEGHAGWVWHAAPETTEAAHDRRPPPDRGAAARASRYRSIRYSMPVRVSSGPRCAWIDSSSESR